MKILICSNVYPPAFIGGAELIAHQQAMALVAAGHEVQIFAGDIREKYPRHHMYTETYDGLTVHRNQLVAQDFDANYVNFSHPVIEENFREVLERFSPDVVHGHNLIGLSTQILRLAKSYGAATAVTLHDHWGYCLKNTATVQDGQICDDFSACGSCQKQMHDGRERNIPIRLRQDYFYSLADEIDLYISPSVHLAKSYLKAGFPVDRLTVNWNGVDFDRFGAVTKTASTKVRFTYVGYFGTHKGVATLLHALPHLRGRGEIHVNLVGEGDQKPEYERILRENGCADVVTFWGKIENEKMGAVYSDTDVLILPSIWPENQPVSITEAMCAGIPVIASRMGGMPEMVKDGETGLTFEANNPVDLADKMALLIESPDLRGRMGSNSRKVMKINSFRVQVSRLTNLYKSIRPRPKATIANAKILCVGDSFDQEFSTAIDLVLAATLEDIRPSFIHHEWVPQTEISDFDLIWLAEGHDNGVRILDANAIAKLPLLIAHSEPEDELPSHVAPVWLTYSDPSEAAAGIVEFCKAHRHVYRLAEPNRK